MGLISENFKDGLVDQDQDQEQDQEQEQEQEQEQVTDQVQEDVASEPDQGQTIDEFYESLGFNKDKDKDKPTINYKTRAAALKSRRNLAALGDAFKLVTEGTSAAFGSYSDKRKKDPYVENYFNKLEKLQNLKNAEDQQIKAREASRRTQAINLFAKKNEQEQNRKDIQKEANDQRAFLTAQQKEAHKNRLEEEAKTEVGNEEKLALAEGLAKIKAKYETVKQNAKNKQAETVINLQEQKEIAVLKERFKLANKEEITEIDGIEYTETEAVDLAHEIIAGLPTAQSNYEEYNKLPATIKNIIDKGKDLTDAQIRQLIKAYPPVIERSMWKKEEVKEDIFGDKIQ